MTQDVSQMSDADLQKAYQQSQTQSSGDLSSLSDDELKAKYQDSQSSSQPDSISKNMQQGQNPVEATFNQVVKHPFRTALQGLPQTITGKTATESVEDSIPSTPLSQQDKEDYKSKWHMEPSSIDEKFSQGNLGDKAKMIGAEAVDMGTAPINALLPMAGDLAMQGVAKAGEAINAGKNKIAEMALSPEFAQDASDIKYGHDARRVMKSMPDIVGNDAQSTKMAINNKLQETGKAIGDTIANSPNASNPVGITDDDIVGHIDDKISDLNKSDPIGNKRTVRALEAKKTALLNEFDANGNPIKPIDFQNMTPQELFDYKQSKLGDIKYTGRVGVDETALNYSLKQSRSNITDKMNQALPELEPLNQDYGDLKSASDAIDNIILKGQKEGLDGLGIKNIITAGLNNSINRVKLAQWLYTAPKAQIQQVAASVPNFSQIIQNVFGNAGQAIKQGSQAFSMAGKVGASNISKGGEVEAEIMGGKALPAPQKPIVRPDRLITRSNEGYSGDPIPGQPQPKLPPPAQRPVIKQPQTPDVINQPGATQRVTTNQSNPNVNTVQPKNISNSRAHFDMSKGGIKMAAAGGLGVGLASNANASERNNNINAFEGGKQITKSGKLISNHGIEQKTLDSFNKENKTNLTLNNLNDKNVNDIQNWYFKGQNYDQLGDYTKKVIQDYAYHFGKVQANRSLQNIVGANPDGKIGKETISKAIDSNDIDLANELLNEQEQHMKTRSNYVHNARGWKNRINNIRNEINQESNK